MQIIVGHNFELLSWMAWRGTASFEQRATGLKHPLVYYLRNNFYGGLLGGDYLDQKIGDADPNFESANNAFNAILNLIGPDRILFTTDYPYGGMETSRRFFDQLPVRL